MRPLFASTGMTAPPPTPFMGARALVSGGGVVMRRGGGGGSGGGGGGGGGSGGGVRPYSSGDIVEMSPDEAFV